jgi:hypothetical protein
MKNLEINQYLKIGSALLLLLCFILPFSSCTERLDVNGQFTILSKKPAIREVIKITYPWEIINPKHYDDYTAWIFLFCFIWPIPIIIFQFRSRQKKLLLIAWILEPLFAAGSSFCVYFYATFFAEPEVGAKLMLATYCIYFGAWIFEALKKISERKKFNKSLHPTACSGV